MVHLCSAVCAGHILEYFFSLAVVRYLIFTKPDLQHIDQHFHFLPIFFLGYGIWAKITLLVNNSCYNRRGWTLFATFKAQAISAIFFPNYMPKS
jgi:hypothetical protein